MDATIKHRRFIWLAAVIVAIYFAPTIIGFARFVLFSRPQAPVRPAQAPRGASQPKALKTPIPGPPALVPALSAAQPANAAGVSVADAVIFASYFGNWQGRAALRNRRLCTLQFELRQNRDADRPYAGYSTLTCTPFWPFDPPGRKPDPAAVLMALKPMSAIITGAPRNGSIEFHVDKALGDNCPMTALTLMPFGVRQIAIQWEDTFCGGGYMVLTKVR